jgi:trigger factor
MLESADVQLPQLLVDEEVNARLSQLVDQLTAVGLTVEQYLKTRNLDPVKLRSEYERTARDVLKLNLALDQIATGRGFTEKDRIAKTVDWLISL